MTDWATTASTATDAAGRVLGATWGRVSKPAAAQILAMAEMAAQMEADYAAVPPRLSPDEYQAMLTAQKDALEGILAAYEAIGVVAAEQAAAAAWAVLAMALRASVPFA